MIIRYPTGLYVNVIPQKPEDSGNVTYVISNTAPPRANLLFPKVSLGVALKQRNPIEETIDERREHVGELIYTISKGVGSLANNTKRQFEIGQILSFDDDEPITISSMLVQSKTEIRHDVTMFNYDTLGLTTSDRATLASESTNTYERLMNRLNEVKQARANAEVTINKQQKIINESDKTLAALTIMTSLGSDLSEVIAKVTATRNSAVTIRDAAMTTANSLSAEANEIMDEMRTIAALVN